MYVYSKNKISTILIILNTPLHAPYAYRVYKTKS